MSNAARKDPSDTISSALVAIKGYKPKDEEKFSAQTNKAKPVFSPNSKIIRYRIPILFGFSLLLCFVSFLSLAIFIGKSANKSNSASYRGEVRSITINKEPVVEYTTVLVPRSDIKPGVNLDQSHFQLEIRPKVSTPATALSSITQISDAQSKSLLVAGQPVLDTMIKNAKTINPVVASIQPGTRAVTIQVNATSSVEGWATAGAFVDIHWITNVFGNLSVNLLAQNAKILSAERQIEQKDGHAPQSVVPTTITLLVNDRDAQKISLASTGGELKMHLRGTEDVNKPARAYALTINDLLGKSNEIPKNSVVVHNDKGGSDEFSLVNGRIVHKKIA